MSNLASDPQVSDAVDPLHAEVDRQARRLHVLHSARLQCRRGCSSCCVDELTVFEVEAEPIRRHHAELLATELPHAVGACAFLDEEGACRIYAQRPYVCRTQGLPLRWLDEQDGHPVELRDICPFNEAGEPIEELPAEDCWTLGPFEERLAGLRPAARESLAHEDPPSRPLREALMFVLGRVLFGLFGLAGLIAIAWLFSEDRRAVDWKAVPRGIALQILFAALVLKVPLGRAVFGVIATGFVKLLDFVQVGTQFIFGTITDPAKFGFVFAVQVLPTLVFFASLTGVLYHLGIMPRVVKGMAWAIAKIMNVSGAEATVVCASVFIGQTEAPLTIRPYIEGMTESES